MGIGETTMVKSADQAAARYELGVNGFGGYEQYRSCGANSGQGFLAVAKCLQDAKKTRGSTQLMVSKYRAAATGSAM
jgi:hypothetical protein